MAQAAIGIDFGTTNTVLALIGPDGEPVLASFPAEPAPVEAFRSALSFHPDPDDERARIIEAGPRAIEAYVEEPLETRLIQSFKSYAASPHFQETRILGRRYAFEDMLSAFLLRMRAYAPETLGAAPRLAIVGRPVRFAGLEADDELALSRYRTAFERLGFEQVRHAFEPVAAAFFYARRLESDAVVLVGDFGGGTSDFSIARFRRIGGEIRAEALANAGVDVAGDAFDYRIIDNVVSPELGKGSCYRAFDRVLPTPNRWYAAFARWEQLALLRASSDMRDIRRLVRDALEPKKIARLV
ncbi:MAG: Hsp70 family protein, partial [Alphaproteobacteria bacterium]|nr:Hsp70 family protein [Alphaproteobacteria bacterium]